jgi:hypothetical protein
MVDATCSKTTFHKKTILLPFSFVSRVQQVNKTLPALCATNITKEKITFESPMHLV